MNDKKQTFISMGLVIVLSIMILGISYAAFSYTGTGSKLNTITTGVLSMSYTESSNTISINKALPTTDATNTIFSTKYRLRMKERGMDSLS